MQPWRAKTAVGRELQRRLDADLVLLLELRGQLVTYVTRAGPWPCPQFTPHVSSAEGAFSDEQGAQLIHDGGPACWHGVRLLTMKPSLCARQVIGSILLVCFLDCQARRTPHSTAFGSGALAVNGWSGSALEQASASDGYPAVATSTNVSRALVMPAGRHVAAMLLVSHVRKLMNRLAQDDAGAAHQNRTNSPLLVNACQQVMDTLKRARCRQGHSHLRSWRYVGAASIFCKRPISQLWARLPGPQQPAWPGVRGCGAVEPTDWYASARSQIITWTGARKSLNARR